MAHETILYGYIEGATYSGDEYRKLQRANRAILEQIPLHDKYPYLSRTMFSTPGENYDEGTFRAQVIHFGASMKGLEFDSVPIWISKFECLLATLYWFSAVVHIEPEIDGSYRFRWDIADSILESYRSDEPSTTSLWMRTILHRGIEMKDDEFLSKRP